MWQWLFKQLDISEELPQFSAAYLALCGLVMGTAFVGVYLHYNDQNNHVLALAIIVTLAMSLYERYRLKTIKSANLTLLSAVVYALFLS